MLMKDGNKTTARRIMENTYEKIKRTQLEKYHKADDEVKQTIELSPRKILHSAVENCTPVLYLEGIKRGGIKYQVKFVFTFSSSE